MAVTVEEYLIEHGTRIGLTLKESVRELDYSVALGERVRYAVPLTFTVEGKSHSGVAAVTTHRFICCSSVSGSLTSVSMPFDQTVGVGDISGALLKQMRAVCGPVSVVVKASAEHMKKLQREILDAIEIAPNQKNISFGPASVFVRSAAEARKIKQQKDPKAKK